MKKQIVFFATLAIALPVIAGIDVKIVRGSEPPGRLVVNGDGTVTDTVTKLIWQQATGSLVGNSSIPTTCNAASIGSLTSGWRTPSVKELLSLVDFESATSPMIDTAAFPGTQNSTYGVMPIGNVVCINFANGVINSGCGSESYVRCVHNGP